MHYFPEQREILFDGKVLNILDRFTLDFINILEKHTSYVLVSGYVSILLGRSRSSEDIDLLVPPLSFVQFTTLCADFDKAGFECLNTSSLQEAYAFLQEHAIRFARKGKPLPNMEFKQISLPVHRLALDTRLKVRFDSHSLYISSLELQIAYKLSLMAKGTIAELSADKDFEDAKHLYVLFKEHLNKELLLQYATQFGVTEAYLLLQS